MPKANVVLKCHSERIKFGCTNGKFKAPINKRPFSPNIDVDLSSELISEIIVYITLKNDID
jgi:hypothetical protein